MNTEYIVERGQYGQQLVLQGEWSAAVSRFMSGSQVRELVLNYARGWAGGNLYFLSDAPPLEALTVIDRKLVDDSAVVMQPNLRSLQLSTYCDTPIDFRVFEELEHCGLNWRPSAETLFESRTLTSLFLVGYPHHDCGLVSRARALRKLTLSSGPLEALTGIGELSALETLGLHHLSSLASLDGLERLNQLTDLSITSCPHVTEVTALAELRSIRSLELSDVGRIASIQPLRGLAAAEKVILAGTTNVVDGNLDALLELPRLKQIAFQNRRHYSHTREQIDAILKATSAGP